MFGHDVLMICNPFNGTGITIVVQNWTDSADPDQNLPVSLHCFEFFRHFKVEVLTLKPPNRVITAILCLSKILGLLP